MSELQLHAMALENVIKIPIITITILITLALRHKHMMSESKVKVKYLRSVKICLRLLKQTPLSSFVGECSYLALLLVLVCV